MWNFSSLTQLASFHVEMINRFFIDWIDERTSDRMNEKNVPALGYFCEQICYTRPGDANLIAQQALTPTPAPPPPPRLKETF